MHTLRPWTQELSAYSFTCVYRPNAMIQDINALQRCRDPLVVDHIMLANFFQMHDISNRKDAYSLSTFDALLKID